MKLDASLAMNPTGVLGGHATAAEYLTRVSDDNGKTATRARMGQDHSLPRAQRSRPGDPHEAMVKR
jgi:hypothetical protein